MLNEVLLMPRRSDREVLAEAMMQPKPAPPPRGAWSRLNTDGWTLVGLMYLAAIGTFFNRESGAVARAIGRVPELQPIWLVLFGLSALFISVAFVKASVMLEVVGRAFLVFGVTAQTLAFFYYAGWREPETLNAVAVWLLIIGLTTARVSLLLSKEPVRFTLPGRSNGDDQ